jgi:tRNA threonylcarbamoyladenosine biosynthesis protein TsaE
VSCGWALSVRTEDPASTRQLAGALAGAMSPGDLVLLTGGLGAGKTVFAGGFAAALGVAGPVTSPTFTLVREYRCTGPNGVTRLLHADLYRLDRLSEVADLALDELLAEGAVALVEWGEAGAPVLVGERGALEVSLTPLSPGTEGPGPRAVVIVGRGPSWVDRRAEVEAALSSFGPADAGSERS